MKSSTLVLAALLALTAGSLGAQQGEWSVGFRLLGVDSNLVTDDLGTLHTSLTVDSGFGLGADVGYLVTDSLGIEASLAASFHDLTFAGELLDGEDAGDEWLVPATLTLVYHLPMLGHVQPYLGAGVGYVGFLAYSASDELEAVGVQDVDTEGSLELVVQAGLDYEMSDAWSAVLDVRYLSVSGDVEVDFAGRGEIGSVPFDGDLWQVGIGFEHRFGYRR